MLPQARTDSACVFHGRRFDVHQVGLPGDDGRVHLRELVVHPGAVVVLALVDGVPGRERVAMIRNERFAVAETLWELPAGTLEPGEDPTACAARELIEESGYRAGQIRPLTRFFTTPGICTELMWAFVAEDLEHVGQRLEASERITVEVVELDRTMQMVKTGEIRDGKTIAALLYYQMFERDGLDPRSSLDPGRPRSNR